MTKPTPPCLPATHPRASPLIWREKGPMESTNLTMLLLYRVELYSRRQGRAEVRVSTSASQGEGTPSPTQ